MSRLRILAGVCLIMLCFFSPGCGKKAEISEEMLFFGTACRVRVVESETKSRMAIAKAFAIMKEYDSLCSYYDQKSELSQLNREAGKFPCKVSNELFEIIRLSLEYSDLTKGAFDVTATSLQKQGGYGNIVITDGEKTIYFKDPGTKIDLGGIVVGYCLDQIAEVFSELEVKNFLVDIGGDIYACGLNSAGRPWGLGVQDPRHPGRIISRFNLRDCAASTSGNYLRRHIMVPRGMRPDDDLLSVTVIAKKGIDADVFPTAFFVLGAEESKRLIAEKRKDLRVIFLVKNNTGVQVQEYNFQEKGF